MFTTNKIELYVGVVFFLICFAVSLEKQGGDAFWKLATTAVFIVTLSHYATWVNKLQDLLKK
jgi:hypothetical protein